MAKTVAHLLSSRFNPPFSTDLCKQSSSPACLSSRSIRRGRTSLCGSQVSCWPLKALNVHQKLVLPLVTHESAPQPCLAC